MKSTSSKRKFSNWLSAYTRYTRYQEACKKFHLWIGLSTLASAIRRNVVLDRKQWNIFPNLYVGIVGPTGDGKTTAADIGTRLLMQVKGVEVVQERATSYYLLELMQQLTQKQHAATFTIYAPEMKNFITDMNKTDLVSALTSFYTCPDYREYRTKGQLKDGGFYTFENVCINVLACSTPEWLTTGTTVDDISGGFTGRFVYVYNDGSARSCPFPEDDIPQDVLDMEKDLVHDLRLIAALKGRFVISDSAKAIYRPWYENRMDECKDERLIGYYSRKRDTILKVAMLCSLAEKNTLELTGRDIKTAMRFLSLIEDKMSEAFAGVVEDPALKYRDLVVAQISRSPGYQLSRVELLRKNWHKFDDQVLGRILDNLVSSRVIEINVMRTAQGRAEQVCKLIDSGYKI